MDSFQPLFPFLGVIIKKLITLIKLQIRINRLNGYICDWCFRHSAKHTVVYTETHDHVCNTCYVRNNNRLKNRG